jgi:DNA-binding transcriptional ArsR family regulator
MDAVIQAIAEPRRRDILSLVVDKEMSATEIASHFDVTRPAVSQHLSILLSAGLVTLRREGTYRYYRARPEGLAELRDYLDAFWRSRLSLLKELAEEEERTKKENTDAGR